jgi:hypothetical protein
MAEQLIDDVEYHEISNARELIECANTIPSAANFRRMIMLLLRGHYAHPEGYGSEFGHLQCYKWTNDKATCTLPIDFTHKHDDNASDNYPCIAVAFGGVTLEKVSTGNFAGHSEDLAGTHLSKMAVLTLNVLHTAKEAGDAYDLADMSCMALQAIGLELTMARGALAFDIEGFAEPKKEVVAPDRYYTVALVIKIAYTFSVTRSVESHRIRRIVLQIDAT